MKHTDNVNPSHYKQGNIEVIDFILDQKFSYMEGNVVKYLSRYKFKNGLEDLKKARWYIDKIITEVDNEKH
jgi:hypothetical protein